MNPPPDIILVKERCEEAAIAILNIRRGVQDLRDCIPYRQRLIRSGVNAVFEGYEPVDLQEFWRPEGEEAVANKTRLFKRVVRAMASSLGHQILVFEER